VAFLKKVRTTEKERGVKLCAHKRGTQANLCEKEKDIYSTGWVNLKKLPQGKKGKEIHDKKPRDKARF